MSDALINGLAGAGGGIIAQLITYPLQTVNTRQQTERDPSKSAARDGAVRQMLEVVKQEGWGRLYGGLAPSLVGTAASQPEIQVVDLLRLREPLHDILNNKVEGIIHSNCTRLSWHEGRGPLEPLSVNRNSILMYKVLFGGNARWFASSGSPPEGIIHSNCTQLSWHEGRGPLEPLLVNRNSILMYIVLFGGNARWNKAETAAQERWRKGSGDGSVGMFQSLVVAALAGCVNVLLTNPIWVVVARMQMLIFDTLQTHKKTNFGSPNRGLQSLSNDAIDFPVVEHLPYRTNHVIQELYDEAGMWGFWKGVVPTLIMVSNPSIQFMLYETLVKKIKRRRDLKAKGAEGLTALEILLIVGIEIDLDCIPLAIFILGAVAKLGATVVTYPLLVVKARLQVKQGLICDKRHQYTGTLDAINKMMRYEGVSGLYKGMGTKIVQSVFAAAVLFMVKEELVRAARVLVTGELRLIKSKSKPP
ncbi:hypothetical protein ZIOFF_026399 [Zingiber officinale]|uniref:Peroxisomal nicotinamide adenine dinucleotide carrier n=1 Tax=Zingiber officinale TaxID=94328 RepID=A0A8J5H3Y9_ZINOF|nr:hypothetical protein ZIOFF_026399 [Zingiber officinale]